MERAGIEPAHAAYLRHLSPSAVFLWIRKNVGNSVYVYRFTTSPIAPYRGADGLGGPHGRLAHRVPVRTPDVVKGLCQMLCNFVLWVL